MVDDAGQPTPGPSRFCNDIKTAVILVICDAVELSVGKSIATAVLLTAWPAATLALRDFMNESLSGGQEHGMSTGLPSAPVVPSQLPVPDGLTPASIPNSGTRDGSTPLSVVFVPAELSLATAEVTAVGADEDVTDEDEDAAGEDVADAAVVPSCMAFCCAKKVVDEAGHPFPVPLIFCKVTMAV